MSGYKTFIDKYVLILLEYIHLFDTSDIIRGLDNQLSVYKIGLHAIAHIYKLTYYITKNAETAGCYTQKGMYCYLEYIEQMNRTHSLHNLNNTDAVLFVYDKTLSEIYTTTGKGSNVSHEQNMFTNIVSLNDPHVCEHNCKPILDNLSLITQTILWSDNAEFSYLEQLNITHEYLPKYMSLYTDLLPNTLEIMKMISVVQDKIKFTYLEYIEFLDMFYKAYKKTAKTPNPSPDTSVHDICLCISVYFSGKTMAEVIASDYGKNEGWKTNADFVKWLFAYSPTRMNPLR